MERGREYDEHDDDECEDDLHIDYSAVVLTASSGGTKSTGLSNASRVSRENFATAPEALTLRT